MDQKIIKRLDQLLTSVGIILLTGITCVVFIGVITRYVFNNPVAWSEEVAIYLQVWLTFLGAPLGILCASHIGISFLPDALNGKGKFALLSFCYILLLVFAGFMFIKGSLLTAISWRDMAETVDVPKGAIYLSFPVGSVLIVMAVLLDWSRSFRTLWVDQGEAK